MSGCTLVMDTSSCPLLLAVEKGGKLYTAHRKGIKQEKLLFPLLRRLLARAKADLPEVSRIFIIRGPGRFTGIRIALTFASMMQMLNKTTVCGATLFEVLRAQVTASHAFKTWSKKNPSGALAVVLHAFREEYFLQIFDVAQEGPQWLSREELLAQLSAYAAPLFVVGTDKDFAPLHELLGNAYTIATDKNCRVQAKTLIALAQDDTWADNALEPLYLKPARFELEKPR